ncbi:MAG: L-threonylcarbamoyladenylate synthase [Candidatus Bathyarchaeia archaeon]
MVIILRTSSSSPDPETIAQATEVVSRGGVIVYPTDTVYGLGADALDAHAVLKVFQVKRRPLELPLPVAVDGHQMAERLAVVTKDARRLMDNFWPGPLTIVLYKKDIVPDVVTGGKSKVAVRAPNHQIPLRIIVRTGLPLTSTSANIHRKPSIMSAQEARAQLEGVDLIIDGGRATGIPSTVIDMTQETPRILRQGSISTEDIVRVLGRNIC